MLKEWPLVAFTILGQTAVGLFIIGLTPSVMFMSGPFMDPASLSTVLEAIFCLLAVAALLSFLHLHHPIKAVRVLANVRTSWLSREILFELLFMALVAAEFFLVRAGGSLSLVRLVYLLAGLAGLLFLLSMVKIYALESLPFWKQTGTPLLFASTSLSLGALSAGGLSGGPGFFVLAVPLILIDLAVALFYSPGHGLFVRRPGAAIRPPAVLAHGLHVTSLGLETAGLILIVGVSLTALGGRLNGVVLPALLSPAVLAAQVVRRFTFYGLRGRGRVFWGRAKSSRR